MRLSYLCVIVGVIVCVLLITQILLEVYLEFDPWTDLTQEDYNRLFTEVTQPVIVRWAPLKGQHRPGSLKQCGQLSCYFTVDRQFRHHPNLKAFLFYGSDMDLMDLPLPRKGLWALLHEESPRNQPTLSHLAAISLFNYTATFSRLSSFPLTTQYLEDVQSLTDLKYFLPSKVKNQLQKEEGLAPVMYLQSSCSTPLNRDAYVAELAKYIRVDSYGKCLHNKDLPKNLTGDRYLNTMMGDDLLHLVAKYKFILSVENGVCEDYITEKLWRPLIAGSVPIYIGSPSVADWLPNNKSAVLGLDFESPRELAEHLHVLNTNDEEYDSYLRHKLKSEVTNARLVQTMESRTWSTVGRHDKGDFLNGFDCFVCEKAHNPDKSSIATTEHYSCPMPLSIISRAPNTTNHWLDYWYYGQCEAEVMRSFVDSGVESFTKKEFGKALEEIVMQGKCSFPKGNATTKD